MTASLLITKLYLPPPRLNAVNAPAAAGAAERGAAPAG
jgi:hypothetical protein